MKLNDVERAMQRGELGAAVQTAIEHQVKVGEFFGAPDFVPVTPVTLLTRSAMRFQALIFTSPSMLFLPEST